MNKTRKVLIICGAGMLALIGLLGVSRSVRSKPPVPQAESPGQTVAFLASDAFAKMDLDDRREYVRQIQVPGSETPVMSLMFGPGVSEEQRRRVMKNVLPVVGPLINQRLDELDRLPPAQRTARLDAFIDQMQKSRREHPEGVSSAERMNLMLQYVDPETRAKMRKHIPALLVRMKQRGIRTGLPF